MPVAHSRDEHSFYFLKNYAAHMELEIIVNLISISFQAVALIIKGKKANVFIR